MCGGGSRGDCIASSGDVPGDEAYPELLTGKLDVTGFTGNALVLLEVLDLMLPLTLDDLRVFPDEFNFVGEVGCISMLGKPGAVDSFTGDSEGVFVCLTRSFISSSVRIAVSIYRKVLTFIESVVWNSFPAM